MNKDLLNQLPTDERPVASKLDSLAEDMQISSAFQAELETQLMDAYQTKTQPSQGWRSRLIPSLGWAILIVAAVFALNWTIRSLAPAQPSAPLETTVPELSFADQVRQGDICAGPLALAHGFSMFLTNEDKTSFVPLETGNAIGEVRSFAWSADGKHLAVIGNTTGSGTIYITEPTGGQREYVLSGSEVGYLRDAAWSRDGRQFVIWLPQNNALYLLSSNGTGPVEKKTGVQILGRPQFTPDGKSVVFYGGDMTAIGLFELTLDDSQITLITPSVEHESGFAFSPDGSQLAYIEYNRGDGETRLFTQHLTTGDRTVLGTWPISRNSGAALPEVSNLSWSPDGTFLVFDFGQFTSQRAVYLARADGSGMMEIIESGVAPAISSDGRCLAYISNKQVFLLDLAGGPSSAAPVLLADLPAGRNTPDLDKLQWKPSP